MLQPEYKRDMYKSYLVLKEEGDNLDYSMKMLANNKIAGFLDLEIHAIDNKKEYYYDTTEKQPIDIVFRKMPLKEKQIKTMLSEIIMTIKQAREYLLSEDHFVLAPEYIYMNLDGTGIKLIYFTGYEERIGEQLLRLIEYIMDKADYNDKAAVCLIYGIYKICREENCTFDRILEYLGNNAVLEADLAVCERKEQEVLYQKEILPEVEEEVESEVEKKKYPVWVWLCCVISVLISMGLIGFAANSGIMTDVVTGKIMPVKMVLVLGVTGLLEAYCLMRLLDEKNKIAYIDKKIEYVKPMEEATSMQRNQIKYTGESSQKKEGQYQYTAPPKTVLKKEERIVVQEPSTIYTYECAESKKEAEEEIAEETEQATVILAARGNRYVLSPEQKGLYVPIYMQEFPFFIGTLKTKVDYVINSPSVSRFHAKIEQENEQFFLVDLNSTNGTFVNGQRLEPNEKCMIYPGDLIAFAEIGYRFGKEQN